MPDETSVWTELSLRVQPGAAEAVAEVLQDLTGSGVAIEPPIEALGPDEGYTLDESAPLTLRAYVYGPMSEAARESMWQDLRDSGFEASFVGDVSWQTIREEDWAEAWKAHFEVEHVGRVAVRPAWRDYEARDGEVVVDLDPGMAFGTGQHPTTRMALQALQELLQPGDYVLDLGTGSGILALAAIGLGASRCVAVDKEEQAVKAARENRILNGAQEKIDVLHGSLDLVADRAPYDLVLANINAATVIALAQGMFEALTPGREMVGGGIIRERAPACVEALTGAGFEVLRVIEDGEWRCIVARRPG